MSVNNYSIRLLNFNDCHPQFTPTQLSTILKAWRNGHYTSNICNVCENKISFHTNLNFQLCCNIFYYKPTNCYIVNSLAVNTKGFEFCLPNLKRMLSNFEIKSNQQFLILPDPIYWQVTSTLTYDKAMKLVTKTPMTKKSSTILPPTKSTLFYKQIQEAPLNHGSLFKRSGGKNTFFRQIAFGKRCILSTRAMIVPNPKLRGNEIAIPQKIQDCYDVLGKWVILNRMPSLQPENFVTLKVKMVWNNDCFGIPLEIVDLMNADFDGDECNLYIIPNLQSQAECLIILNSERNMGSFTSGIKLSPCQDAKTVFYLFKDKFDFLPPIDKNEKSLKEIFKTIYDLYGSKITFECFNKMRKFYLDTLENKIAFGISLAEMERLEKIASNRTFEKFQEILMKDDNEDGCLVTQVKAESKGSFYHLYQMFGSIGNNGENSFWKGLTPLESVNHAMTAYDGLLKSSNIWQPGYGYSKSVYNLQSLHVDYFGRLVDGENAVVETDVLDALHHTDLLSEDVFNELLEEEMK